MNFALVWRGVAIGLAIAAPVGPIGVLCIRRTLAHGRAVGLSSGLGAAAADATYGLVAAFGLTFVGSLLVDGSDWLRLAGGLYLLLLGIRTFLARPAVDTAVAGNRGLLGAFVSTYFLTLTNPATILSFVGIFAGLGLASDVTGYGEASLLVAGVFLGSVSWWTLLSGALGAVRGRFDERRMRWVNRFSGAVIAGFGVAALASLLLA